MELKNILIERNVVKQGHFLLNSGKHSDYYVNKDSIYCDPELFHCVIHLMIRKSHDLISDGYSYEVITGPAIAGAILAAPFAYEMKAKFVYPEKIGNGMEFRRGYDKVLLGKRVLVVEDIVTTGASLFKTIRAVRACGGIVDKAICIWNRSNIVGETGNKGDDFELISLINQEVKSYDANECPLCGKIPLVNPKDNSIITA